MRTLDTPAYFLCGALNKTSSTNAGRKAKRIPRALSPVSIETIFLIEFKPFLGVWVEGTCGRSHRSGMLTSEDHRQLAERCIRLAKECTNNKPSVAEHLMRLAANYLELAEAALRLREPATAVRRQYIRAVQKE